MGAPVLVEALIRRCDEEATAEFALVGMQCAGCGNLGAKAIMLRLCEQGCHQ